MKKFLFVFLLTLVGIGIILLLLLKIGIFSFQRKTSEIISLDKTWNKYVNYQLGFSLKVPKETWGYWTDCKYVVENGHPTYRPQIDLDSIKILEDYDKNVITIAPEYDIKLSGETQIKSSLGYVSYYSKCEKTVNSLEKIKAGEGYPIGPNNWSIIIKQVKNDKELENLIKEYYGSSCTLGQKRPTYQSGVYDVDIKGDDKSLFETQCPLNYRSILLYYPEKNKIARWNMGQDVGVFFDPKPKSLDKPLDNEMVQSFEFLKN